MTAAYPTASKLHWDNVGVAAPTSTLMEMAQLTATMVARQTPKKLPRDSKCGRLNGARFIMHWVHSCVGRHGLAPRPGGNK